MRTSYRHLDGFNREYIQSFKYEAGGCFEIVVCGETAEAKADRCLALLFGKTQGAKHMGGLWDPGCAGGAGGRGKAWLQGTKNVLRVETIKSDIGITRMAVIADGAVEGNGSMPALQMPDKRIALIRDSHAFLEGGVAGEKSGGCTHANTERHRHSARTQSRLLPAAVDQRLYLILQITANIQGLQCPAAHTSYVPKG